MPLFTDLHADSNKYMYGFIKIAYGKTNKHMNLFSLYSYFRQTPTSPQQMLGCAQRNTDRMTA
jgi:hypothetical protein